MKFIMLQVLLYIELWTFISPAQSRLVINNGGYVVMNGGTSSSPLFFVIENSNPNAITRNTSGHIISENEFNIIQWNVGTTIGTYTFPLGKNTSLYVPLIFDKTTGGIQSGTGMIRLGSWYAANNSTFPYGTTLCGTTEDNVVDRFWLVDVLNYSSNPAATIDFYYISVELQSINENDLQAQRWNSSLTNACKWETPPVGMVNTTNKYVRVSNISNFSPWTLVRKTLPLPVEWLYFTAIPYGNNTVKAKWTTATEINNNFFAVERSKEGIDFEQIGTVQGGGNSNITLNYVFYDEHPFAGLSYYRLRQVDTDGKYSYSEIRSVYIGTFDLISIFPNPSKDFIQYVVASEEGGTIKVQIVDALGKEILNKVEKIEKGTVKMKLRTANLSNGNYFLQLTSEKSEIKQKQFVIE